MSSPPQPQEKQTNDTDDRKSSASDTSPRPDSAEGVADDTDPTGTPPDSGERASREGSQEGNEHSGDPTSSTGPSKESSLNPTQPSTEWQAIWSPAHNTYYFFNARTQETTWVNPLQAPPEPANSTAPEKPTTEPDAKPESLGIQEQLMDAAQKQGIDPALAYLDPTLYASGTPAAPGQTFTAKFNARTGRFTTDSRDPTYLSEAERAKRMSSVFFDVEKWEQDISERNKAAAEAEASGSSGEKRKRPTKKDLDRWKEAKKQKKLAKHAWLRN
ncbi:hypothetical protein FRB99_003124 [Tulasnella sp. 403]|nr:hypothetical protein FRB99_003124 [Tulasnella sp. 403]